MIYLASPYSHPNPAVRRKRFEIARAFVMEKQAELGTAIFSPIVYCHQFAEEFGAPTDAMSWSKINIGFMQASSELMVLCLPGWEESKGVTEEIAYFREAQKLVRMVEP